MIKLHLFRKDKHFIHIKKDKFINDMRAKYSNSLNLLDQFKEDYELIEFKLNGKPYLTKSELLNYIISKYEPNLETILLLCNQAAFSKSIEIIKNNIPDDLHIIQDSDYKTSIFITLHHLAKQIFLKTKFKIIRLSEASEIMLKKSIIVKITIDISNSEDILMIIENDNYQDKIPQSIKEAD